MTLLTLAGCSSLSSSPLTAVPQPSSSPSIAASPALKRLSTDRVRKVTVVRRLKHPWGMVWLPDGSLLITERPGRLRLIRNGVPDPAPIAGVPEVLTHKQGGLLDISLHPNFAENQWLYFTYAHGSSEANRTRVARARFDGKALQDVKVIFEVTQAKSDGQHFGSRITWLPDKTMLIAFGDGGNPPVKLEGDLIRKQAQNLQSRLGKIVRLNDDGSIPEDNPFVKAEKADPSLWSYGHRNTQGLTFDPVSNRVWQTEHGAKGGDELNQIQSGQNYGWPIVTYSREYSGGEISQERSRPGMVDPKTVWTPSIAPSGLMVYQGDRFPQWKGNLLAGGLVSKDIRRLELDASGNVVKQTVIPIGQRVRDVRQGPDGLIYVLTDEFNGQLIRLEPTGK